MSLTNKQLAAIHAWKNKQPHMDEAAYRDWLLANFGVSSSKNMNAGQFSQFLAMTGAAPPMAGKGYNLDLLSVTQNRMILALWGKKTRVGGLHELSAWLYKNWKVKSSRQLTKQQASQVISVLQKGGWNERQT